MTTDSAIPPAGHVQPSFRFRLVHVFYAMSLLAAAMATFGAAGVRLAVPILGFWAYVFFSRSRPRGLADGCLVVTTGGCLIALLLPCISPAREAARRATCANHLKNLAIALHNYQDDYGVLPPAFIPDDDGRPMHSWRVLLLPYVEEESRYRKYNFQEPWDGPNNSKLLDPIPWVYACPSGLRSDSANGSCTSYVAVVGPRTAWPGASSRRMSDISDGAVNTALLVEAGSRNTPWMEPRDLTLEQALQALTSSEPQTAGVHRPEDFFFEYAGGRNIALADGSVQFLHDTLPRAFWSPLLTIDDGAFFYDVDSLARPAERTRLKFGNCYRLAVFVFLTIFPLPWVWRKSRLDESPGREADMRAPE